MEQAPPQYSTEKPLKELRFNAHAFPLKDSLMLLNAQGGKKVFQEDFQKQNAYLFAQEPLKLDIGDAVYRRNEAEGYSLNASLFSRYEMVIQDISQRGLKKFLLGPDATIRTPTANEGIGHYVDMEVILGSQDASRILCPPLYGALQHYLPMDDETEARVRHENQKQMDMVERGRLPVTYRIDRLVQNDNDVAINRLRRILKSGVYVSQLAVVSSKTSHIVSQSPRLFPIYPRITRERPYKNISDIDAYLDATLGPELSNSLVSNG